MTVGTAIVVSIGIICGTFLAACLIGCHLNKQKLNQAQEVLKGFTNTKK